MTQIVIEIRLAHTFAIDTSKYTKLWGECWGRWSSGGTGWSGARGGGVPQYIVMPFL